jgi:hypothetical protein
MIGMNARFAFVLSMFFVDMRLIIRAAMPDMSNVLA